MKNRILFILTIAVLFLCPATSQAGFLVKKHNTVHVSAITAATTASGTGHKATITEAVTAMKEAQSPSGIFVNMLVRGQISTIALLCGIVGFFIPIFAVGAVIFGFMGFSNRHFQKKGYGIAAFILGVAAIAIVAFGGLAPLPIF